MFRLSEVKKLMGQEKLVLGREGIYMVEGVQRMS